MADQLSGEWFAAVTGFGPLLESKHIRQAAESIMHHCFDPEGGLLNAVYPPDVKPQASTYLNAQATANWTGIEYAFASLLLELGIMKEALAIIRSVDIRHRRAGVVWNHIECGEHYYRAMASWATMISATGFKFDATLETVTFSPSTNGERFRAPWFTPSGWGVFSVDCGKVNISVIGGQLNIKMLRIGRIPVSFRQALLDKQPLQFDVATHNGLMELSFKESVKIKQNRTLELYL